MLRAAVPILRRHAAAGRRLASRVGRCDRARPGAAPVPCRDAFSRAEPVSTSAKSALARIGRDRRAAAATEFALVLPLLLSIWAGFSELNHATDGWRKLTLLGRTVADLTAQGQKTNPIASTLMTDIFASAALVMRPFDTSKVKIVVSAMGTVISGTGTNKSATRPIVCSSLANANGTARPIGVASDLTIPAGYATDGQRYVLAEVSVPYTPMIGSALAKVVNGVSGSITLSTSIVWPVRGGEAYAPNTYNEVILPISPASTQKACDGKSAP